MGNVEGEFGELSEQASHQTCQERTKLIAHVVELSEKIFTKGNSILLQQSLKVDVPNVYWKRLNRKATFKMKDKKSPGANTSLNQAKFVQLLSFTSAHGNVHDSMYSSMVHMYHHYPDV